MSARPSFLAATCSIHYALPSNTCQTSS